ncbi:hypothetical protein [Anditalea andensis]|uniref:Uncharacterized protein n=1 Tax=Anditalea andensis TaxID=1048983 RepID=A0A074L0L3_9BACT|nr:hypothetical protein [Anditalea andensis]KEO73403.1 hypothetical protein EL17_13770 [Anditalea andensis]
MAERIEYLLEKYWAGESSLEEEKELKGLLNTSDQFSVEKEFFEEVGLLKDEEPARLKKPAYRSFGPEWLKMAAVFALFMAVTAIVFQYQKYQERKEEALAYAQVMEAFTLINDHMLKGTNKLEAMEEFRHLKTAQEIFELRQD